MRENEWLRDAPFLLVATALHALFLASNPALRWGGVLRPSAERTTQVEFVTERPSALLAPVPAGDGRDETHTAKAPGPPSAQKIKKRSLRSSSRKSVRISAAQAAARKAAKAAQAALRLAAREAKAAALTAARERRQAQLALAAAARKARSEAVLAEKALRVRRKAEVSRELAMLSDPDEALELQDSVTDAPSALKQASLPSAAEAVYGDQPDEQGPSGEDLSDSPSSGEHAGEGGGLAWSIDGPVGNRRLLQRPLPQSPDWVAKRGLALSVQVKFQVLEDGSVKIGAVIKKTSGFPEIDRRALSALKSWRFQALPAGGTPVETWGSVTFRFSMG